MTDFVTEWPDEPVVEKEPLIRVNIRLTQTQIDKANLIGQGFMARGVRQMIDIVDYDTTFQQIGNGPWLNIFSGAGEFETFH